MDGEEFYDAFKDALYALNVGWGSKKNVEVSIRDNKVVFSYNGREYTVEVNDGTS